MYYVAEITHMGSARLCMYFLFLPPAPKQAAHRALQIGDLQLTRFAVSPFSQKGTLRYHLFGSPALNSSSKNKKHTHILCVNSFRRTSAVDGNL